jgi:hypothetical protein
MGAFEYRQAEEIRDAFARHGVRYLFIGKSGAILLGFPDTTPLRTPTSSWRRAPPVPLPISGRGRRPPTGGEAASSAVIHR